MPEKRDIFVSYSRANTEFARDLYTKLQSLGFTLWRDRSDMEGGEKWWEQIKEAIRNVDTMVLIMSPAALQSQVVAEEWRYALQEGTRVIPVIAEDIDFNTVPRWMRKRDWYDFREGAPERDLIWDKFIAQLKAPYQPRRVPFTAPAMPERFINRPAIFDAAKARLLATPEERQNVALTTAFRGSGGFGKTSLAIALCHDPDVRERFDDGVLFITFGEAPDALSLINDQIRLLSKETAAFTDINVAAARFRELVDDRDMLIVLDDVWNDLHAQPFLEGKRPVRLITTRSIAVANALGATGDLALEVNQMEQDEAVALLLSHLPAERQPAERAPFRALARELGGWALLVNLAGAYIADLVINDGMSAGAALGEAQVRLREYGFTAFDAADEAGRNRAIAASMEVTLRRLGEWRERFLELAIFPDDTDIPFEAIQRLWQSSAALNDLRARDALRAMHRLSLFVRYEMSEMRRYARLHDAVRKYMRSVLGAERLQRLNDAFLRAHKAESWSDLPPDEPYLWDHLAYHLLEAGKRDELRAALLDYRYLRAKLAARSVNALLSDFDACLSGGEDRPIRLVRQALELSADRLAESAEGLDCYLYGRLYSHRDLPEIGALRQQTEPKGWQPMHEPTHHQAGGHLLRTLRGHEGAVEGALELRDGRLLSWSWDETLRLWAADGAPLATLRGHAVAGALELRDGRLLSWSWDETLRLWAADGAPLATLRGHAREVLGALELSDGRLLSWSWDETLRLWAADGAPLATLRGHAVAGALALRDGRLLSWSWDNTLRLWAADGAELATLRGHEGGVRGALELRDGRLLSWSWDRTLRLWAADGAPLATLQGHEEAVLGALELRDGRLLSWDYKTLRLWAADGAPLATLQGHEGEVRGALELRDGRLLSWAKDWTLRLWAADGAPLATLRGHAVAGALELRDGRLLSWSADETLRLWAADGAALATLRGHEGGVLGALELRDGRLLSWSDDKTLQLWAADGTALATLLEHEGWVEGALELRDGRLLSQSWDGTLRLWAADGAPLATLQGHERAVEGVLELRDGRLLSWSWDGTLRLWAADGAPIDVIRQDEPVGALRAWFAQHNALEEDFEQFLRTRHSDGFAPAPDRGRLLWWEGNVLQLYNVETDEVLASFHAESWITRATFLQNGRTVALWCENGQVIFLRVLV
jgi:WD40 repeat protein